MTKDEFCEALRVHIAVRHKRQSVAAKAWGVSAVYVSQVLKGKRTATPEMLEEAGFERIQPEAHYKKLKPSKEQSK